MTVHVQVLFPLRYIWSPLRLKSRTSISWTPRQVTKGISLIVPTSTTISAICSHSLYVYSDNNIQQSMWNKYSIIHPSVQKQLAEVLKYPEPTEIQKEVLENYKHYYDFLLASQTGSGKTLAFGIPIVSDLISLKENNQLEKPNPLSCLILTPTRELAIQIEEHINAINADKKLLLINIVGGLSR